MSDIPINPVTRRVQFTGNTGLGPFAFTFNIYVASDIAVYRNAVLLTLTTDYTVTIAGNGTGSVTLTGSGSGTTLTLNDSLTIVGARQLARTTDFVTAGDLLAVALNEQLDSNVIMSQQLDEKIARSIKFDQFDTYTTATLPAAADRADKIIKFDVDGELGVASAADFFGNAVLGANYVTNTATGTGSQVAFGLTVSPGSKNNVQVYIDGVYQNKASFSISAATITFSEAPPLNSAIEFIIGQAVTEISGNSDSINYTQGGTGSQQRTLTSKLQESVSVKDFGAVGDGVADDTAAIQAAIDAVQSAGNYCGKVYFPRGIYLCNVTASCFTRLVGENHGSVQLKSAVSGGVIIDFEYYPTVPTSTNLAGGVEHISLQGTGTRQDIGIRLGDSVIPPTDIHAANSMTFSHVKFENLNIGFFKPYGQIAQLLTRCVFTNCNYGYNAQGSALSHAGFDKLVFCAFIETKTVALRIEHPWLTELDHCWFELNRGICILLQKNTGAAAYQNMNIKNTWFEANGIYHPAGPFSTVVIGALTYDTKSIYVEAARMVYVQGSLINDVKVIAASVHFNRCVLQGSTGAITSDSRSAIEFSNMSLDNYNSLQYQLTNILEPDEGGSVPVSFDIPHRNKVSLTYGSFVKSSVNFADTNSISFTNDTAGGSVATTSVRDGILFDRCQQLVIPANTQLSIGGDFQFITADTKHYLMTVDVKQLSAAGSSTSDGVFFRWQGVSISPFRGELYSSPIDNRWHTVGSVFSNIGLGSPVNTCKLFVYNNKSVSHTMYLSGLQILEFGNRQDVVNYIRSRVYSGKERSVIWGAATPTSGTWAVGDRIYNSAPSVGNPKSWVCTVAGTPGTWVSEGNL
jgi:hypothetical protein